MGRFCCDFVLIARSAALLGRLEEYNLSVRARNEESQQRRDHPMAPKINCRDSELTPSELVTMEFALLC